MGFIGDAVDGLTGKSKPEDFAAIGNASSFTIEQITGERRKMVLTGRGLPKRPYTLKSKQRSELVWLPGSDEATLTVLGPSDDPTSISGKWSDKFIDVRPQGGGTGSSMLAGLGDVFSAFKVDPAPAVTGAPITLNGRAVDDVREAVDTFDKIVREGQLVRVTWDHDARVGLMDEFERQWQNAHDCEWTMKFSWTSRGVQPKLAAMPPPSPKAAANKLLSAFGELLAAAQDPKFSLTPDFVKDLNNDLKKVGNLVDSVGKLAEAVVAGVMSPVAFAQNLASTCSGMVGTLAALADFVEAQNPIDLNDGAGIVSGLEAAAGVAAGFVGGAAAGGSELVSADEVQVFSGGDVIAAAAATVEGATVVEPPAESAAAVSSASAVAAAGFGAPPPVDERSFGEKQQATLYIVGVAMSAKAMKRFVVELRAQYLDKVRHEILAVYIVRDNEDLRHISRKFYDTMDHWQDIMIFNGFASSVVARGTRVYIPNSPDGRSGF